MLSSRARSRFAVLVAAVPLVAAGPLVSPAFAASATVSAYPSIGFNNTVGPNAGFRNVAQGVRGNTAVLTIDMANANASLDKIDLKLNGFSTGPAIVPDRDFAQTTGFGVYKDVSDGSSTPDGTFGPADFALGPVSTGYTIGTPSGGFYPIHVAIDGVRATNSARYFVTVNPADAGPIENRDFVLTVPSNGIRFGDTTMSPADAVATPRLTIDSKAPITPKASNFQPQPQPPLSRQTGTPKEDAYLVTGGGNGEANDPDKTLIFLNDGNNTAPANFLVRSDGTPAISVVPTVTSPIFIGDGTGITATNKVARNNQLSDDVFVRAFDTLGNLSPAVRLFDAQAANTGDKVDRANDVTAPAVSGTAATIRDPGTVPQNSVRGIYTGNVAAVKTRATFTAPNAAAPSNGTSGHSQAAKVEVRWVVNIGGVESTDPADASPWVAGTTSPTSTSQQTPDMFVNTTGVGTTGSQMRIQARLMDLAQNETDIWKSALLYPKDLIRPQVTGASFEVDNGDAGVGDEGDKIRIRFSEPMFKSTITETSATNPCQPVDDPTGSPTYCINTTVTFPEAGNAVTWGANPTVVWSADLTSVLVTLGAVSPDNDPTTPRLPVANDKIRATDRVQDPAGNSAAVPFGSDRFISPAPPIAGLVTTADTSGRNLYNQGRDGYLDHITATFPVPLTDAANAVPANLANFKIFGSSVITPDSVTVNSATSITFAFGGTLGSGETPKLVYTQPASGGLQAGGVAVPSFTVGSVDKAAPVLQLLTTKDNDADGHLDQLIAKYSEPIDHSSSPTGSGDTQPAVYYVPGYENQPTGAAQCPATGGGLVDPWNSAAAGTTPDTTVIALCEKTTTDTGITPGASIDLLVEDLAVDENGDSAPNAAPAKWSTGNNDTPQVFNRVLDKAPPVAMSRTTKDLNSDGRLDAIDIVYSELLDGVTIEGANFIVSNRTVSQIDLLSGSSIRLGLTPIAPGLVGDTDSKPTVQYTGGPDGGIKDASDQRNPLRPDAAPVATTDGAGPAITAACAGGPAASNTGTKCPVDTATDDKLVVFLSEPVSSSSVATTDFSVEQPFGTNKAVTAVDAAVAKQVTLTLANNAINPLQDVFVRFTAANAVMDASTPAQGNTQVAPVIAPAPPAVKLAITCPTPSSPGYCGATFVNTGAEQTAGLVRMWRLAETARGTTPPDSEFSSTQPTTYPPTGALTEGVHTLYLSGKDDFGRLSTEVSQSVNILKAPTISNVTILNATAPASNAWGKSDTVLDGDTFRVGADAYGTDAAQWVSSSGGCLSAFMQINYKAITGAANQTAVAPFACDLKTNTVPPHRHLEFPFVKVSGTTHYPFGTVLRLSSTDPGSIIQDGPNGTQIRRQFISVNARRSYQIPDASVITVPASVLNGIARGRSVGYRDGSVVKSSTSGYYYTYQNVKRPISPGLLAAWKMTQVYTVSQGELNAMATGAGFAYGAHAPGTWVKFPDGSINQIVRNKQGVTVRRAVTSSTALRTLVPGSQIYSANSYDRAVPFDATWVRGYRDGTLLRFSDGTFGVVARSELRKFADAKTFNSLGFNAANALTFAAGSMPHAGAQTYVPGVPIGRYKITDLVIKVTNKAGGVATATVLPAISGIWGVGTLDPIPSGYDNTHT